MDDDAKQGTLYLGVSRVGSEGTGAPEHKTILLSTRGEKRAVKRVTRPPKFGKDSDNRHFATSLLFDFPMKRAGRGGSILTTRNGMEWYVWSIDYR